jgi:two-component system, OmpR family, heavy metal sensor histidine kinase CusS
MRSIRAYLMVGAVATTVGMLALASVAVYRGARAILIRQFDEALASDARIIASTVRTRGDALDLEFDDIDVDEFTSPDGDGFLQLSVVGGGVLYRSPSLGEGQLPAAGAVELDRTVFRWIRVGKAARVRAVDLCFVPGVDDEGYEEVGPPLPRTTDPPTIHLIAALEPVEVPVFLARLRALFLAVGVLTGLMAAGIIAVVIRTSLRSLNELATEIANLSDDDLSSRVRVRATPREMKPVVEQLNQLLARLESAFQRERTFSADIAHELRTPLAGLRSTIEVALSRPRREADYRETMSELLEIICKVQAMVETLLYLGRLEAGQVEIEPSAVDLGEVATASWKPLVETAEARRLAVKWILVRDVTVITDPILLEVAIRNLLENAVIYADEGGYVRVEVVREGDRGVLRVINSGSTVSQENVGDLLRRFTRADLSRKATGGHSGLGLALVSKIAAVLRYSMRIESRVGGEFSVTISSHVS